jgi:hypothetical protein
MRVLRIIWIAFVFISLTVLTQVGGLVYLVSFATHGFINKRINHKVLKATVKVFSFLALYAITTFLVIPILTKPFGRVALPCTQANNIRPLNFLTCLLNRHYVRPALQQATITVAKQMNTRYPGTIVNYLDAGFPFVNGFPLVPHLSHNDGKKLDLAFCYIDNKTGRATNDVPSVIGYGISEEPRSNEVHTADQCARQGNWQYSFLTKMIPQGNKQNFTFDSTRTKVLVNLFVAQAAVGKVFIEPHLKKRLQLTNDKVRFHGCQAVRHDDHIHVQLK